jgi:3-oxoacyl-[acyl-carrier protein] reductase
MAGRSPDAPTTPMKTALITGASRGIGRALALAFGRAGYAVGVNYIQEKAKAEAVVQEIFEAGNKEADVFGCDVRDSLKVRQMMDSVVVRWGHLDVLINNAGIARDRTILKMTNGEWNEVMDVNLSGAFWCLREAARLMAKENRGVIISIASLMAIKPGIGNANYCVSKAGLVALTKAAAKELGRFHITVNAVLPGFHETGMAAALPSAHKKKVIDDHVTGQSTRMEDLCRMVLELAQNPSVSGQVFNVDSRVI